MKGLLTLIISLFAFIASAQFNNIAWQECLGTDHDATNQVYGVEKCGDGYLFAIQIEADGPGVTNYHGSADTWIVRTDSIGNILWEKCYGGTKADSPEKIIRIDDNNFYLLSWSNSIDGDVQNGRAGNFWVVKINASGDILWECSYGGSVNGEEVRDAILLPDKGLVLMGRIWSTGGDVTTWYGGEDIWMFRIDSCGSLEWEKTFGNEGWENAIKIKLTSKNTVLMAGCHELTGGMIDCNDYGYDFQDVWIVEMDIKGKLLNQWCYGGSQGDMAWDIVEEDDGYVIAASTNSTDGDVIGFHGNEWSIYTDIWAFKIDFNGNIIWQKCLGGSFSEVPTYITQTADGGYIVIGYASSNDGDVIGNHSVQGEDIWVVKLNGTGELEWQVCFGGANHETLYGIHTVLKNSDYDFVLGAISKMKSYDVECDPFPDPYDITENAWLLEIKDCHYLQSEPPVIVVGPDSICSYTHTPSLYSVNPVSKAKSYDWSLYPEDAGTLVEDSLNATITWNPPFEGQVTVQARSFNDCGYSAWSESYITQVYTCMGVEEHGGGEAWGHGKLEVWPNPCREVLSVKCLGLSSGGDYSLSIYDIFGREIKIIDVPNKQYEVQLNIESFPSGVYVVILRNGLDILATRKFVVAR